MKPRTLLVLLLLVAGLGAFVWFWEREQPGSEERAKLAKRVLGVERENVTGLAIDLGGREVELVRTAKGEGEDGHDQWRLRKPIDFAADYWAVDGLVRSLAELERERALEEYRPEDVGLDAPRGKVTLELEDGGKRTLEIGAEVPGSGNLVVLVEGEPGASVVAGTLWSSLDKDPGEWRDKDLFHAEREDVAAIELERPGGGGGAADGAARAVRLERTAGSDFELVAPLRDRADQDAVNELLRELTGLRASDFLDQPPPLAELGLDPPRGRITAALDQGEPVVIEWGERKEAAEETYARVGELVVTTAAALDRSLEKSPESWRSLDWSALPVFEIDHVTATDATGAFTVDREEGSWSRGEDSLEYGVVSDLLYAVDDAKAQRLATADEPPPAGEPVLTLEYVGRDPSAGATPAPTPAGAGATAPKRERLALFSPRADGLVPARSEGRDAVLLLRRESADEILAKLRALREARPAGAEPTPDPGAGTGVGTEP